MGWVVESPEGLILRKFIDTNGDNVVNQWSYYKDGVEVYRDIDSDFNGKPDQYRWLNAGGTRWGVDKRDAKKIETGKIEYWRAISAEEATAEAVAALATRNVERFRRLLLTPGELQSLGLDKARTKALATKLAKAEDDFNALLDRPSGVAAEAKWLQMGGARPGTVPAEPNGPRRDLRVYENVFAVVQMGGKSGQVRIGTLIQVGDVWRLIEAPSIAEGQAEASSSSFFFQPATTGRPLVAAAALNDDSPRLLAELEKLDQFDPRRPELLEQIANLAKTPEERTLWYRQTADTITRRCSREKRPTATSGWRRCFIAWGRARRTRPWPPTCVSASSPPDMP